MFVAADNDQLVGFISGNGGTANRNKHSMYCIMGIEQRASGLGIGTKLLDTLEQWAQENEFTRLELTVMGHNKRAIGLYLSCGFEIEGTKKCSLRVDGHYVDELYMAKLLR